MVLETPSSVKFFFNLIIVKSALIFGMHHQSLDKVSAPIRSDSLISFNPRQTPLSLNEIKKKLIN